MIKFQRHIDIWILLGSIGIATFLTAYVYIFSIQSPVVSRREPLIGLLLYFLLVPAIYFLLQRIIIPNLLGYSLRGRVGWLLLSAFIGLLAVIATINPPYFIRFLPEHSFEITVPDGMPDRSVTLQWFSNSLGDIGFGQLQQIGVWERTTTGLVYTGSAPTKLNWKGRVGDYSQLVFATSPSAGLITIIVDGRSESIDLSAPPGSQIKSEWNYQVSPVNRFIAALSLWFSISFLFLTLTLFLIHIPIKIGNNFRPGLTKIERALRLTSKIFFPNPGKGWWQGRDWIVLLLFFLISSLFFLGRWNGLNPFIDLRGDAAYVSSFAASIDKPAIFARDPLFYSPRNFGYYSSLQIPIIRALTLFTGNYGMSYVLLLIPFVFIQLSGFYFFGRILFRSRFFAILLAVFSIILFNSQSWDYWGVWYDPQPRMMFQAFFPWLLAFVLFSLTRQRLRWLVFIALGIMIYIHPVSIPAVAFSIWLGYLVIKPMGVSWKRHLFIQFLYGCVFLVFTIPFFIQYFTNRDFSSTKQLSFETARTFLMGVFPYTFHLRTTFSNLVEALLKSSLLPLAYLGAVIVYRNPSERQNLCLILVWLAGIVFICIGFNSFEQFIEFKMRALPILVDVIRGFRYTIPLLEVLVIWPLAIFWIKAGPEIEFAVFRRIIIVGLVAILLTLFTLTFPRTFAELIPDFRFQTFNCLVEGQVTCPSQELKDKLAIIEYIRKNSKEGSLLISIPPTDMGGAIRFHANRPVSFDPGDMNRLALGNVAKAIEMNIDNLDWTNIGSLPIDQQLYKYLTFARKKHTDFAVIQSPAPDWLAGKVVYSNTTYSLIDLR
jgi:hypothetical protein